MLVPRCAWLKALLSPHVHASWRDPNDPTRGDVHYYNTEDNCLDLSKLPRAKFVSEFGHLSWPSWEVYRTATEPQDWSYASNMSDFRCAAQQQPVASSACQLAAILQSLQ